MNIKEFDCENEIYSLKKENKIYQIISNKNNFNASILKYINSDKYVLFEVKCKTIEDCILKFDVYDTDQYALASGIEYARIWEENNDS